MDNAWYLPEILVKSLDSLWKIGDLAKVLLVFGMRSTFIGDLHPESLLSLLSHSLKKKRESVQGELLKKKISENQNLPNRFRWLACSLFRFYCFYSIYQRRFLHLKSKNYKIQFISRADFFSPIFNSFIIDSCNS